MLGKGHGATIAIAALLIALLLSACGDDSGTAGTTAAETAASGSAGGEGGPPASGAEPNAWNAVNKPLRADILSYGDKGSEAQVEAAAAVVSDYLDARSIEDSGAACSYMSPRLIEMVTVEAKQRGERGCIAGVENLAALSSLNEVEEAGEIDATSVRISRNGKRAFLIYDDAYGDVYAMLMRPEDGAWQIHGFEAIRLY
jgi:hypothetical protein